MEADEVKGGEGGEGEGTNDEFKSLPKVLPLHQNFQQQLRVLYSSLYKKKRLKGCFVKKSVAINIL